MSSTFSEETQVRIVIRIDISISIKHITTQFGKQVHLQELTEMRLIKQVMVSSSRQDHVTLKGVITSFPRDANYVKTNLNA